MFTLIYMRFARLEIDHLITGMFVSVSENRRVDTKAKTIGKQYVEASLAGQDVLAILTTGFETASFTE